MAVHYEKTLYSQDKKGKTRVWTIRVVEEDQKVFLQKSNGTLGGKLSSTQTEIKSGKNLGKANETTVIQQGINQANGAIKKQVDAGYVENEGDIVSHDKVLLPMLANDYEKFGSRLDFNNVYIQPKLDGVRLLVYKKNGEVYMMSRTGKEMKFMDHIRNELAPYLDDGWVCDGEAFAHNLAFEDIVGEFRREQKTSQDLKYNIFDCFNLDFPDLTFEQRFNWINNLFAAHKFQHILMVPTRHLQGYFLYTAACQRRKGGKDVLDCIHDEYVEKGYEGLILRSGNAPYELNTRSKHLLKYKKFMTEEFDITEVLDGKGTKNEVVCVCRHDEKTFRCRLNGTMEYRKNVLENRARYVGRKLTVKFFSWTADGQPRFPVGIAIRDYE